MAVQHPKRIGKYEIQEYLGGGMSCVYRALDPLIDKTLTIKVLTEEGCSDEDTKARFLREAKLAAKLDHENVVSVYDFGQDDGRPFMVMEYVRGEDLKSAIVHHRTGDLANKLRIAGQIAGALEYIHAQGIIHRDIKPENIRINSAGNVKLIDFGIAKSVNLSLTRDGFTLGTPYYMAPEQVRGKEVTQLVDVYAFGILLFELLSGTKPFTGDSIDQIFFKILQEPINVDPLKQAGIPAGICSLIGQCTEKAAERRIQSFQEVRRRLEAIPVKFEKKPVVHLTGDEPTAKLEPMPANRRRWLVWVGVAVGLAIAYPVGRFFISPSEPSAAVAPEPKAPDATPALPASLTTPTGEMVLVPAGSFLSGEAATASDLGPFYIDKTEVTNQAFAEFCRETQRKCPQLEGALPANPVVNVSFMDAAEFAKWAGKRLPTMKEWEKAARGTDGRLYPWGNDADPARANVSDNPKRPKPSAEPAANFDTGKSPSGVLNMAGNVWEFVEELRGPSPSAIKAFSSVLSPPAREDEPWYVMMGGSFEVPLLKNVTFEWASVPARFKSNDIGFRCVKTP